MITYNKDNMVSQNFPFKDPTMDYLFKNVQPKHLLKLYQTCKHFYAKFDIDIIRNLVTVDDGKDEIFDPITTIIRASNPALEKLKDFWITDSFIYRAPLNLELMPEFSNCTIKKLEACDHLAWSEYEALTRAGTIAELKIGEVVRDGVFVSIEDIIAQVPNATSIEISESRTTETTFESLASLNHHVKITKFILRNMTTTAVYSYKMKNFFFNHVDPDCNVHLSLQLMDEDGSDAIREYNEMVKEIEKHCNEAVSAILKAVKYHNEIVLNEKIIAELKNSAVFFS